MKNQFILMQKYFGTFFHELAITRVQNFLSFTSLINKMEEVTNRTGYSARRIAGSRERRGIITAGVPTKDLKQLITYLDFHKDKRFYNLRRVPSVPK